MISARGMAGIPRWGSPSFYLQILVLNSVIIQISNPPIKEVFQNARICLLLWAISPKCCFEHIYLLFWAHYLVISKVVVCFIFSIIHGTWQALSDIFEKSLRKKSFWKTFLFCWIHASYFSCLLWLEFSALEWLSLSKRFLPDVIILRFHSEWTEHLL